MAWSKPGTVFLAGGVRRIVQKLGGSADGALMT
jgi:hypothetical protein